jgi:hypothetical protein
MSETASSTTPAESARALWVGIDEAGYGPNLGPLVLTAIVAEGPAERPPDLWADLPATVCRAGGDPARLWIDDSKRVYAGGAAGGLDRLEAAALAAVASALEPRGCPTDLPELLEAIGAGTCADVELAAWLEGERPTVPRAGAAGTMAARPLSGACWRVVAVRSEVVGPERFNALLERAGNKADAHFVAFARLLGRLWDWGDDRPIAAVADKLGGRHYYYPRLVEHWPDAWIERGPEGPELSHYVLRRGAGRLELRLRPRGDSEDGLVALASIVSKYVRERWMAVFNAYWQRRVPELRPTAGYPGDAARFRAAIEACAQACGHPSETWWRQR